MTRIDESTNMVFLRSVLQFPVTVNVAPSSLNFRTDDGGDKFFQT
jgi:hypothetical protein